MSLYSKGGDQLCPLGFWSQVRWPTRCKRCFRDYKEHGVRRNGAEDFTSSTPSLSDTQKSSNRGTLDKSVRSWTSTQNLSSNIDNSVETVNIPIRTRQRPSSWASTPDLENSLQQKQEEVVVNLQLPIRRRHTAAFENVEESITLKRPPIGPTASAFNLSSKLNGNGNENGSTSSDEIVITKSDSLADRVRKMQMIKRQGSLERETSRENSVPKSTELEPEKPNQETEIRRRRRVDVTSIPESKTKNALEESSHDVKIRSRLDAKSLKISENSTKKIEPMVKSKVLESSKDIFMSHVKEKAATTMDKLDSFSSNVEYKDELEKLKRDLETTKLRAERAERDKSDILLRRLASMDTGRTGAAEALKLQQKVNEQKQQLEDLHDDKKSLSQKIKELETDLTTRTGKNIEEMLRNKLDQAERMCEALMDENEDMKRELKCMEGEIDEMHDNFREEQADEYVSVKKELEQTTKNCRILSFKLKKAERKVEQLDGEKKLLGSQSNSELATKIKQLEDELKISNEVSRRLQTESEQNDKTPKKKAPTLGKIGKSTSDGGKISRESLTRGGSQEDPVQLLRDLQDSLEREADLREQLKFAEEEAESSRKKSSRIEDENESLIMQLKKMATKARLDKATMQIKPKKNFDEGFSDEDDPSELKLQLELNEQETAVLRRKVEEMENENETSKKQIKDLQEKVLLKTKEANATKRTSILAKPSFGSPAKDPLDGKKMLVMEDEINELRKKLIEKDREFEHLQAEVSVKGKSKLIKNKTLDSPATDQQSLDLKRQMQVVEQEASVLRTKTQTLEQENDKLLAEVKKQQLQLARVANKTNTVSTVNSKDLDKLKSAVEELEKENITLQAKLKKVLEDSTDKLPVRTPRKYSELTSKLQIKKMIEESEEEILEMRAIMVRTGAYKLRKLEEEKVIITEEFSELKKKLDESLKEIQNLKAKKENSVLSSIKQKELEQKLQKAEDENKVQLDKIKSIEEKLSKQEILVKQVEAKKVWIEDQFKSEKDQLTKLTKDYEKEKREKFRLESKVGELDSDLITAKKSFEKTKLSLEQEINLLKNKTTSNELPSIKLQELKEQNKELEERVEHEYKNYSTLNGRYELLEEEHVVFKAKLSTEKEKIENELSTLKIKVKNFDEAEIKWKKENQDLNKRVIELQKKLTAAETKDIKIGATEFELSRLRAKFESKESEYDRLVKENEMNVDQLGQMRKDNDEMKRKLNDFDRFNNIQRTLNDHNVTLENELKKLKLKLETSEMAVKSEVASTRLRYEQQANNLQNEISSMQRQCERYKKDRESYKQLLEAAQKNIGELKQNRKSYASASSGDEDDKTKISVLEQQIGCLEDELSESKLDASKMKTEIVSERSGFEIKMSEMQSKLNEYEEERILGSSKVSGTKTRLELSWQKEREDQQRLLQETSTLARDLRQTLFEVERERDKERLESRRKIDQIKKATEEELEEGRRKISELQSDLLELRDAHAKLRTANEKLRRDRERERENGSKRRFEQAGERKVGALLQTVDELVKFAPDFQVLSKPEIQPSSTSLSIPNPPRRSKSRSPSPTAAVSNMQISTVLARLAEASDELRRYQRQYDEERDRDRMRRDRGMRRAASSENENNMDSRERPIARVSRSTHGSLYRKSLSLDQSMQAEQQQQIWKESDGSMSSMQSIDSEYGIRRGDLSIDSRLSAGSTQSDMPRGGTRKKKRGLMGKLRSLTKSRHGTESEGSQHGSDSDLSLAGDHHSSKKDLRDRLSGMFKRSASRSGSTEKILSDSMSRPVSISTVVASSTNGSKTSQIPPAPAKGKPPTPVSVRMTKRVV